MRKNLVGSWQPEDGRKVHQITILWGLDVRLFYRSEMRKVRKQTKNLDKLWKTLKDEEYQTT